MILLFYIFVNDLDIYVAIKQKWSLTFQLERIDPDKVGLLKKAS
jgi:hypothetical protein